MSYAKASATPTGRAIAAIMASLAELEVELGASTAPDPENPVAPGICRPPNPRSSAQYGKNSCAGLLWPGNLCINWPKRSESDPQLHTAISPLPQPESAWMVTGERKVNEKSLICPHSAASSCP
jgi:hypothetical protein